MLEIQKKKMLYIIQQLANSNLEDIALNNDS